MPRKYIKRSSGSKAASARKRDYSADECLDKARNSGRLNARRGYSSRQAEKDFSFSEKAKREKDYAKKNFERKAVDHSYSEAGRKEASECCNLIQIKSLKIKNSRIRHKSKDQKRADKAKEAKNFSTKQQSLLKAAKKSKSANKAECSVSASECVDASHSSDRKKKRASVNKYKLDKKSHKKHSNHAGGYSCSDKSSRSCSTSYSCSGSSYSSSC